MHLICASHVLIQIQSPAFTELSSEYHLLSDSFGLNNARQQSYLAFGVLTLTPLSGSRGAPSTG
jgi:hypothetical protein